MVGLAIFYCSETLFCVRDGFYGSLSSVVVFGSIWTCVWSVDAEKKFE